MYSNEARDGYFFWWTSQVLRFCQLRFSLQYFFAGGSIIPIREVKQWKELPGLADLEHGHYQPSSAGYVVFRFRLTVTARIIMEQIGSLQTSWNILSQAGAYISVWLSFSRLVGYGLVPSEGTQNNLSYIYLWLLKKSPVIYYPVTIPYLKTQWFFLIPNKYPKQPGLPFFH